MNDNAPQQVREELTIRKFGGAEPKACHPEDLLEETTIVIENGSIVSIQTTTAPARPAGG